MVDLRAARNSPGGRIAARYTEISLSSRAANSPGPSSDTESERRILASLKEENYAPERAVVIRPAQASRPPGHARPVRPADCPGWPAGIRPGPRPGRAADGSRSA